MTRYYFHMKDGGVFLDSEGLELSTLEEVRKAALTSSGEALRDGADPDLWNGTPWRVWVTTQPDGEGDVVCELEFSAKLAKPR